MRITRTGAAALVLASILGLAACSSDDDASADASTSTAAAAEDETATPSDEATEEPSDEATDDAEPADAGSGDYTTAAWAYPVTNPGTLLTTLKSDRFSVDVYQVGVEKASKTGNFVDPETNKPIIDVGDDIVVVNYVVTNTSDETLTIGASLVSVDGRYADWPYLQGMDSVTDFDMNEKLGINQTAAQPGTGDEETYTQQWEPGTSFSIADNFRYQAGSPITFDATLYESDDAGDLVQPLEETSGDTTIQ
ncbi:hypothetical protein CLV28_3042 [Sediminihabitans luteus]|uniref:DUF4352 domain-containing protein n=1 Tax=Sediminihabitans luteus TaxID=1138585 RepID=A0A2M9CC66_9CELL|nr:hypothetical protein [Sediminihabitans luteus]PJJ68626.1 hypothetical protein CLV28_3042 [Sediminihabitans luteus]GII99966.1 hypothetical protein Slu03_23440 [Sediminihabitans luteus]